MGYDNVIMPSGLHMLPFLSHPDEIANFDFSQHAVSLRRFRIFQGEISRDDCDLITAFYDCRFP